MILVCTANGRVGIRTVKALTEAGHKDVIAGVRDPSSPGEAAQAGVEIRRVDYDDLPGMTEAFKGVERVIYIPSFADTEQRAQQGRNAVAAAQAAGVGHYVAIGIMDARADSPLPFAHAYAAMENAIKSSKLNWTIARTSMYTDNLAEQYPMWLKNGVLVTCAGDGKISYVSRDDIAAALAGLVTTPLTQHAGKTYTLTGPDALTYEDVRDIVSEVFDRPIEMKHVETEAFAAALKEIWGVAYEGHEHVARVTALFQVVFKQGMMADVTDHVAELSGRPPETVRHWLERHDPVPVPG